MENQGVEKQMDKTNTGLSEEVRERFERAKQLKELLLKGIPGLPKPGQPKESDDGGEEPHPDKTNTGPTKKEWVEELTLLSKISIIYNEESPEIRERLIAELEMSPKDKESLRAELKDRESLRERIQAELEKLPPKERDEEERPSAMCYCPVRFPRWDYED